jgi:hypothetical protein
VVDLPDSLLKLASKLFVFTLGSHILTRLPLDAAFYIVQIAFNLVFVICLI